MRLATACLVFAAGLTSLSHHDSPDVPGVRGHRPTVLRPVRSRASRAMLRVPLARHRRSGSRSARAAAPPAPPVVTTPNFAALAACESGGNPRAVDPSGTYFGLYQFDVSTWAAMGGHGLPSDASPAEQTARATALYRLRGTAPWPTCGWRLTA